MNAHQPPQPIPTLFASASRDLGEIEGIGHVVIREAILGDVFPYMALANSNTAEFGRAILSLSLEIDGKKLTIKDFDRIPFSKFRKLQELLPIVLEVNGIGDSGSVEKDAAEGNVGEGGTPAA